VCVSDAMKDVGNHGLSVHDIMTNLGNDHMGVY
jgi:hypothetical protein